LIQASVPYSTMQQISCLDDAILGLWLLWSWVIYHYSVCALNGLNSTNSVRGFESVFIVLACVFICRLLQVMLGPPQTSERSWSWISYGLAGLPVSHI